MHTNLVSAINRELHAYQRHCCACNRIAGLRKQVRVRVKELNFGVIDSRRQDIATASVHRNGHQLAATPIEGEFIQAAGIGY